MSAYKPFVPGSQVNNRSHRTPEEVRAYFQEIDSTPHNVSPIKAFALGATILVGLAYAAIPSPNRNDLRSHYSGPVLKTPTR